MKLILLSLLILAALPLSAADVAPATATATLMDQAISESLPGSVQADITVTLMARVPGQVARIAAVPGSAVAAGAELVTIDAREINAKRDQAVATVAEAKAASAEAAAAVELTQRDLARTTQLHASGTLPQADLDVATARHATALARREATVARIATAEAAVAEVTTLLGYTRLTAPFAAVVVKRHVESGDLLSPGRPVITLEDPTSLRFVADIPESLASHAALGTKLRVTIPAANLEREATVVEVASAADPVSRTVRVKLACSDDGKTCPAGAVVRSGQFGRVAVPVTTRRVLTVPASAVIQRGQLDGVLVMDQGQPRLRLVRLGEHLGERVVVRAGLSDGEVVKTAPNEER